MKSIYLFSFFFTLCCLTINVAAQSSIRLEKPQNKFLFVGLNTQIKSLDISSGGKKGLEFNNQNTRNQLFVQFQIKNKQLLQKGYTRKIAFNSFSTTLNTETDVVSKGELTKDAFTRLSFRLNFLANFATKWDRTNFSIGTRSLPYGHNPRVDAFFSFMPSQARYDLGFNNDIGAYFRTALSEKWDIETTATLGGFLKTPPIGTKLFTESSLDFFQLSKEKYKGTFLLTGRIGTPVFKKNEIGFYTAMGKIVSPFQKNLLEQIIRIGGDFTHKFRDGFKFTQQVSFGTFHSVNNAKTVNLHTLNAQTGLDALILGRVFIAANNSYRLKMQEGKTTTTATFLGSVGFVLNPNNQLRANTFVEYDNLKITKNTHGVFLQLIAGFGQR